MRRLLRFFDQQLQKERSQYETFYAEHGQFLKEGVCTDFANKEGIAKLLLFAMFCCYGGAVATIAIGGGPANLTAVASPSV